MCPLGSSKLVSESEWMKTYQCDSGSLFYESKFLVSGLTVSADSIKRRWKVLQPSEKHEFALAYQAKPSLSSDDEQILDFLMEVGDPNIWTTISPLLSRHTNRVKVLDFLLGRIAASEVPKANFYQAIEALGDSRAVEPLRAVYLKCGEALSTRYPIRKADYLDYLQCCRALWTLSGADEYERTLRGFLLHDDGDVRRWAKRLLATP